ncbi:tyrosine-type recombinase/integrase [Streptosporangium canum]|uniref:tyrosine-type recombinase/integrase n=1 Tax=Streptosporangium canum TaxID=324952 RepID=UPI0033BA414F
MAVLGRHRPPVRQPIPTSPNQVQPPSGPSSAKGGRLTSRAAGGIIAEIAQTAGLDDPTTAHVLRHTLATTLVRGKTDLVLVAEILGHARLETTRRYSLPSDKDKEDALKLITVDR